MAYHTVVYLFIFLPAVLFIYQLAPRKVRWAVLLLSGYVFFWLISGELIVYFIGATLVTYFTGLCLLRLKEKCKSRIKGVKPEEITKIKEKYKKFEKWVLTGGISVILMTLVWMKYYNFFMENINYLLKTLSGVKCQTLPMGNGRFFPTGKFILPVGISFYTLQAIGYMVDVYWGKIPAEKHPGKIALFLGFFPQIMEGPISMYSQTAKSLWKGESLTLENLSQGAVRIFWGIFKKMIIADRLYFLVQAVFNNYEKYSGVIIVVSAIAYTVQLYMEFSGCMDIVIGSGKLFGVTLPENFRQPFMSQSAAEFWRRWHITLGVWFKTYVFYPISISKMSKKWSRFGKKYLGKYLTKLGISAMALFPVWILNGLWHGPQWNYIFYGMYYFVILLAGVAWEDTGKRIISFCHINEKSNALKIFKILKTWIIIFTGELFFGANGLKAGMKMFLSIFKNFSLKLLFDGTFLGFGLDKADYMAVFAGCLVVAAVGILKERNLKDTDLLSKLSTPLRWTVYYALIMAVIIFGAYGTGYQQVDLIYAGF